MTATTEREILSYSALNCWRNCPRKYKLRYLHHGSVTGRFTIGDRVVQKADDYNLEIFNGLFPTKKPARCNWLTASLSIPTRAAKLPV